MSSEPTRPSDRPVSADCSPSGARKPTAEANPLLASIRARNAAAEQDGQVRDAARQRCAQLFEPIQADLESLRERLDALYAAEPPLGLAGRRFDAAVLTEHLKAVGEVVGRRQWQDCITAWQAGSVDSDLAAVVVQFAGGDAGAAEETIAYLCDSNELNGFTWQYLPGKWLYAVELKVECEKRERFPELNWPSLLGVPRDRGNGQGTIGETDPPHGGPSAAGLHTASTGQTPYFELSGWAEIFGAINEIFVDAGHGRLWDHKSESQRKRIKDFNSMFDGPIRLGIGTGSVPKACKLTFQAWWKANQDDFRRSVDGATAPDVPLETHQYGREGTVVPEIGGSVKRRKEKNDRK